MAALDYISFGDFEVPPLDLSAFSVPTRTQDPAWELESECSDTTSGKGADEESDATLPQQEAASSSDLSNLNGGHKSSNSHTEQHSPSIQKVGKQEPLPGPSEHQTILSAPDTATLKPSSGPAADPVVVSMAEKPNTGNTAPSKTIQANQEAKEISITSDGCYYLSVDASRLQTSKQLRAAVCRKLGLASDTKLLIYLITDDGVTGEEALADGAFVKEVLFPRDHSLAKFLVLQDTHQHAGPQRSSEAGLPTGSTIPAVKQGQRISNHYGSDPLALYMVQTHDTQARDSTLPPYKPTQSYSAGISGVGLKIDTPAKNRTKDLSTTRPESKDVPPSKMGHVQSFPSFSSPGMPTSSCPTAPGSSVQQSIKDRYQFLRTGSPPTLEAFKSSLPKPNTPVPRQSRREVPDEDEQIKIRDGSRARNVPVDFVSGELCDHCQTLGHQRFHCNVCNYVFCDPCWMLQFPHRVPRSGPGVLPHEKTDVHIAKKISNVFSPQSKEEQREKLHMDDIDTTWFGVVREGHERPMFQDYGRYATLVATVKEMRLGTISSLSTTSATEEALYPSLVSFVGQTGAGKSSLIKLLIDLKSDEDEPFETPVVGAAGSDVATSEDVHLYLDPDSSSSESQAPLLFADCEGLEGGERDPAGAKFKRKMASVQNGAYGGLRKPTSERELAWADTPKKQSRDFAVAHLYPRLLYTFSDVIVFVLKNPRYVLCRAGEELELLRGSCAVSRNWHPRSHISHNLLKKAQNTGTSPLGLSSPSFCGHGCAYLQEH
jgi:energy-coupling factor transporter ATP-binding protein EcfA2